MRKITIEEKLIINQDFFYRYQGSNMENSIISCKRLKNLYNTTPREFLPEWINDRMNEQWHLIQFFSNI